MSIHNTKHAAAMAVVWPLFFERCQRNTFSMSRLEGCSMPYGPDRGYLIVQKCTCATDSYAR